MKRTNNDLKLTKKRSRLACSIKHTDDDVFAIFLLMLAMVISILSCMVKFIDIFIPVSTLAFIMLIVIQLVRKMIARFRLSKISLYLPLNKEDWERIGVTPKNVNDIVTVFVKITMELKLEKYLTFYFSDNLDRVFMESFNQAVNDFALSDTKIYGENLGRKIVATYQNEFCGEGEMKHE